MILGEELTLALKRHHIWFLLGSTVMALKIDNLFSIQVCFTFPRASKLCSFLSLFFSSVGLFPDLSGAIQTLFHEAHL